MSNLVDTPVTGVPTPEHRNPLDRIPGKRWFLLFGVMFAFALVRQVSGSNDITSANLVRAAVLSAGPILMAAMGGLWSERAGVVNIGLEGQLLFGTWGAAYGAYHGGAWGGLVGGIAFGAIGGLLHAVATITFRVDHIVSGVAINIIGSGLTTFLADAIFPDYTNGSPGKLNGLPTPPNLTLPVVSDKLVELNAHHWFLVSDVAGFLAGLTTDVSAFIVVAFALVALSAWLLWRTSFGLRLRACGESPAAAESLGVNVYAYKYFAVIVSGAFAGVGGALLTQVASNSYTNDQSGGRGYIGLAAMIFGNWRPGGTLGAAVMFGYTDALRLRDPSSVHALLLLVAIGLLVFAGVKLAGRAWVFGGVLVALGGGALVWYLLSDSVPRDFTGMTPYVVTLLVLALASQRLRPPAADGQPYRKGSVG